MAADGPALVALTTSGGLDGWAAAGFTLTGEAVLIGSVAVRSAGAPATEAAGVLAWAVTGVAEGSIDGLPTVGAEAPDPGPRPPHPNRVVAVDHLVVASPDLDRTTEALAAVGVDLRRTRDVGRMEQRFFRLGEVVLELVGRPGEQGPGPATFWGLALTVDDLDATADLLGDGLGPISEAVQPGRRIATLRHEAVGLPVPIAFLTPAAIRVRTL